MLTEEGVKTDVTTSPAVDTSSVEKSSTSAATENTVQDDPNSPTIPRTRLNQEIEKRKSAETKLAERDKEFETHKAGIEISKAAIADPVFAKEINKIVNLKNEGKLTAQEAKDLIENAKDKSEARTADPEVEKLQKSVSSLEQEKVQENVQRYVDSFEAKAKTDGYTDKDDLEILNQMTTKYLLINNPNAPKRFSQKELDEAYEAAKTKVDAMVKRKTAGYVKEKVAEQPPVTKTGSAGTATKEYMSSAEATRYAASVLKARKSAEE